MRHLTFLAIALLTTSFIAVGPALAQRPPEVSRIQPLQMQIVRDSGVEQAALTRQARLANALRPEAKAKLDLIAGRLVPRLATQGEKADPIALARAEVSRAFIGVSPAQSDLLTFYVLAEVAREAEMTSLRLQMMMDRRSKFMTTLSNILKKSAETQSALIQNIK
jgi:hypothetical protein